MTNSHDHSHHQVENYNLFFVIGILLNVSFVLIEAIFGFFTGSLALLADAGHNLTDVLSLLLAWSAHYLSLKLSSERKTYGYKKSTVLASLFSSIFLIMALGGILWEAVQRFANPIAIPGMSMILVASIGVLINGFTAYLFSKGQREDLNIKAAYLHMLADAGVSVSVVIGGIFIYFFQWNWMDPLITIGIVISIFIITWGLVKDSVGLSLDFVPNTTDIEEIKKYLNGLENVQEIHDLHVWGLSTREIALTVHIVLKSPNADDHLLNHIQKYLHDSHHIEHSTIQLEYQAHPSHYDPRCN